MNLPASAQPEVIAALMAQLTISAYSGPLPPPEILEGYERVVPGGANRVITMVEQQAAHRQTLERTVVLSDVKKSYWGLGLGFAVVVMFTLASYNLIMAGHGWQGTILGTVDLATIAGLFVYGTVSRRSERQRKADQERALRQRDKTHPSPPPESQDGVS